MESDIIQRARQGDDGAWETLVSLHHEAVFRLAYLLMGSAADADDVAQEVFVRAYRYLHTFDSERPLRPWLLRIAANLSRNRQRALGRYWAHLRRLILNDMTEPISDPGREYAEQSNAQALWQAVRRLEQNDQDVIYLRYFLELSVDETAAVLLVAPGTVKSRLHRALARLRTVVESDFPLLKRESVFDD